MVRIVGSRSVGSDGSMVGSVGLVGSKFEQTIK